MKKIIFLAVHIFTVLSCVNPKQMDGYRTEDIPIVASKIDTASWVDGRILEMKEDSLKLFTEMFSSITDNHKMFEAIEYLKIRRYMWSEFIEREQGLLRGDKTAERLSKIITRKANNTLASVLPIYRKTFANNLASNMWEHDIYVSASGDNNSILNMTGGIFASNSNIKDFQELIEKDAKHYGFKQVRYRWYKGSSEYTFYEIK